MSLHQHGNTPYTGKVVEFPLDSDQLEFDDLTERLQRLKNQVSSTWEGEVKARLRVLQCPTCRGVNPYVCECAKQVWMFRDEERK